MARQDYANWNDIEKEDEEPENDQYFHPITEIAETLKAWLFERPHADPNYAWRAWIPKSTCTWSPGSAELAIRHWFTPDWKIQNNTIQEEEDVIIGLPNNPDKKIPPF